MAFIPRPNKKGKNWFEWEDEEDKEVEGGGGEGNRVEEEEDTAVEIVHLERAAALKRKKGSWGKEGIGMLP